jgi:hypothetical protein
VHLATTQVQLDEVEEGLEEGRTSAAAAAFSRCLREVVEVLEAEHRLAAWDESGY